MELVTKFTDKELKKLVAEARTHVFDATRSKNYDVIKLPEVTLNYNSFSNYIEKNNIRITRNFQPLTDEEKLEWKKIAKPYLKKLKNKLKKDSTYFIHEIPKPPTKEVLSANKVSQQNKLREKSSYNPDALLTDGFYWDYYSLNQKIERDKPSNFIRLIISHGLAQPVMFRIEDKTFASTEYFTVKNIINHILDIYHNKLKEFMGKEFIEKEFMDNHKTDSLLKCEKNNTWVVDFKTIH